MGNWTMVIEGAGPHHNPNYDNDADKLFRQIVEDLRAKGQQIEHAAITCGGREKAKEE